MELLESNDYKENKERVKEIYGGCAVCGTTRNLTVHHIVRKSEWEDLMAYEPVTFNRKSNLVALCRPCHDSVEEKYDNVSEKREYTRIVLKERRGKNGRHRTATRGRGRVR